MCDLRMRRFPTLCEDLIRLSLSDGGSRPVGMLQWLKPHTLIYSTGRCVCVHNVKNHLDRFTKDFPGVKSISCIDVHPSGLVAIGVTLTEKAASQIVVVDSNAQCKVLIAIECKNVSAFISTAFDATGTTIVCISRDAHNYKISVIDWQRSKFLTDISFSEAIHKARFNPRNSRQIILGGAGCIGLRFYAIWDSANGLSLKLFMHLDTRESSTDVQWIDDTSVVVVAHHTGLIVNMVTSRVLQTLNFRNLTARCVSVVPQGILLGCSGGYVSLWTAVTPIGMSTKTKYFRESETRQVGATDIVAIDVTDDLIALGLENQDVGLMSFNSLFRSREANVPLKLLYGGAHSDKIVGVDVSVHRNICITCSLDKSIRVWNLESKHCDMCLLFQDAPMSVGIHPSGLLAVAAFPDTIRCFHLVDHEMRMSKEIFLRSASILRFSPVGNFLAGAYRNGKILIVSVHSFDKEPSLHHGVLESHHHVAAICFSDDGKLLASGGNDGAFQIWCLETLRCIFKLCSDVEYLSIAYVPEDGGNWICVAETQSGEVLRTWDKEYVPTDFPLPNDVSITSLNTVKDVLGRRTLIAATSLGTLCLCPLPVKETKFDEYLLHTHDGGGTTFHMALAGTTLITAGHDGSIHLISFAEPKFEGLRPNKLDLAEQSTIHAVENEREIDGSSGSKVDSVGILQEAVQFEVPYASSFVIHNMPSNLTPRMLMEFFDSNNLRCGEDVDFFHVSTRRILRKRKFCFVHCTSLDAAIRFCSLHGKVLFPDEPHSRPCRIEINKKLPTLKAVWDSYRQHGRRSSAVFWPCETSFDCFTHSEERSN